MKAKNDQGVLASGGAVGRTRAKNMAEMQAKAGELPPASSSLSTRHMQGAGSVISATQASNWPRSSLPPTRRPALPVPPSRRGNVHCNEDQVTALKNRWATIKNSNIIQTCLQALHLTVTLRCLRGFLARMPAANMSPVSARHGQASRLSRRSQRQSRMDGLQPVQGARPCPMVIKGVQVQPGMTYGDFQRRSPPKHSRPRRPRPSKR